MSCWADAGAPVSHGWGNCFLVRGCHLCTRAFVSWKEKGALEISMSIGHMGNWMCHNIQEQVQGHKNPAESSVGPKANWQVTLGWEARCELVCSEVIFWSWCQCWKAARAMASAQQVTLFGFSPSPGRNFPITSPKFVWASTVSSVKVQSLSSWLVFLSGSLHF